MEKYILLIPASRLDDVMHVVNHRIQHNEWLEVETLGNFAGLEVLPKVFGGVNLGWSPAALKSFRLTGPGPHISVPFPETLPSVRDRMEDLASQERPTLEDWLNKNSIGNRTHQSEKVYMQDALAIMRRMVETPYTLYPETINQLTEMRTLIHTLIGTGENCDDAPINEYPEAIRKATRLDAMDALHYAIRALLDHKDEPGVKTAINSIYGTAVRESNRLSDALKHVASASMAGLHDALYGSSEGSDSALQDSCKCENVRAEEPNALFIIIDTDRFEATPENVAAVNSYITNAGEGRDIHLQII